METVFIENSLSTGPKPKDCSTPKPLAAGERQERNTLHVLQESAKGNIAFASQKNHAENRKEESKSKVKIVYNNKSNSTSSSQGMKIYEDSSVSENGHHIRCSRSVQTDESLLDAFLQTKQLQNANLSTDSGHLSACLDQEAYDLMVNESVPETYWKDLAEQRRQALNDTLEENKHLSFEVEQLKEENRRLSDIASKAEYLENLLQEVLSDDTEAEGNGVEEGSQTSTAANSDSLSKSEQTRSDKKQDAETSEDC